MMVPKRSQKQSCLRVHIPLLHINSKQMNSVYQSESCFLKSNAAIFTPTKICTRPKYGRLEVIYVIYMYIIYIVYMYILNIY